MDNEAGFLDSGRNAAPRRSHFGPAMRTLTLCLLCCLAAACPAETAAEPHGLARQVALDLPVSMVDNLGHWAAGPSRFGKYDWLAAGLVAGGTLVLMQYDSAIYKSVSKSNSFMDRNAQYMTLFGDGPCWVWTTVGVYGVSKLTGHKGLERVSLQSAQTLFVSGLSGEALRAAFSSPRPYHDPNNRHMFDYGNWERPAGFPSGHTMGAFSMAEIWGAEYGRWWTYPLAALVGCARVWQGYHWASDVVAGAALGVTIARSVQGHWGVAGLGGVTLGVRPLGQTDALALSMAF